MGKSARLREERKLQREAIQEQLAAQAKKKKMKRLIATIVIAAVALVAVAAILVVGITKYITWNNSRPENLRNTVVMETENVKIDGMMMAYYIYSSYQTDLQNVGDMGIDSNTKLKEQYYNGVSWFDLFAAQVKAEMRQIMLFAEKAKELGITLTDDEKKKMEEYIATLDLSAYNRVFGLEAADLQRTMELTEVASKVYSKMVEEMALTDKDLEKYYKENEVYFKTIDYKTVKIPYGENGWFVDAKAAKAAAEVFKKATTSTDFDNCLTQLVLTLGGNEDAAKQEVADANRTGVSYQDENEFFEWAYEKDRKVLDMYIYEADGAYNVCLLTSLPTLPEKDMRNVRHILLEAETDEENAKAKAKAEEILAEWKAGEATAESFGKLAEKYSEDEASAKIGGLYENVPEGKMIEEFNDWLFDEDRKSGDTEIVETDYGYHVMYYVGAGQQLWQVNAKNALITKEADERCAEYIKTWPISTYDELINHIQL